VTLEGCILIKKHSVGLGALSYEEERFHFGMWAISKSPLVIGAPANPSLTPAESLAILLNKDVVALNQDRLGEQAQLIRRYTEEGYDIFAGNLSGSRKVIGVANWSNSSKSVDIDLQLVGVQSQVIFGTCGRRRVSAHMKELLRST
jgi:alpha-galactosidase